MHDSFGARLRQQREERQIDLVAISERTKIKLSLLEALERDDVSEWPSGIFRRGYVRTYAQFIGLDPDVIVREFLESHPDPGDIFVMTAATAAAAEEAHARHGATSVRFRTIVDSALGSLSKLRRPAGISPSTAGTGAAPADELFVAQAPEPVPDPPQFEQRLPSAGEIAEQLQAAHDSTLETVARLCTELGRVVDQNEVQQLLQDAARVMNATGLIVWLSNEIGAGLRPALAHGYSDHVLTHLPTVKRDDDNATAAAFRTGVSCEVAAAAAAGGAIVVPLLMPEACAGVLAVELEPGMQPTKPLRAIAVLLAAALMQLVHRSEADYERTRLAATARTVAQ